MKNRHIWMFLILLLLLMLSSCTQVHKNIVKFTDITSQFITMPANIKTIDENFKICKVANGTKQLIYNNLKIYNPKRYEPIVQLDDDSAFFINGYVYHKKANEYTLDYNLFDMNQADSQNSGGYLSPDHIMVSFGLEDDLLAYPYYHYGFDFFENKKSTVDISTRAFMTGFINTTNKDFLQHLTMSWGTNFEFYYDDIQDNGQPCISKLTLNSTGMFKPNARYPSASDDGKIFSYWQTDVFSEKGKIPQKMIIEGNGKVKEYNTEKVIKFNDVNKEIYVIDVASGALETLDENTFKTKRTGQLDKDFLFPEIVNGKLQYTCPIRENGIITDWKIVSEM